MHNFFQVCQFARDLDSKSISKLAQPPKPFAGSTVPAIQTNNRQLNAVPELKLKQDGNSGSALRSIFALGEKNKNKNKKDRLVKKKIA